MTITILTPTSTTNIKNAQSKAGHKALIKMLHVVQGEKVPFIVLPPKATAHDLHELTSIDNLTI